MDKPKPKSASQVPPVAKKVEGAAPAAAKRPKISFDIDEVDVSEVLERKISA